VSLPKAKVRCESVTRFPFATGCPHARDLWPVPPVRDEFRRGRRAGRPRFPHRSGRLLRRPTLELASANPSEARGELWRWLAIRRLADEKDRLGNHKESVRALLGRLVRGADEFARDHARVALARIDGKPVPILREMPKGSLREALTWFPEYTNLVGVLDLRAPPGEADQELRQRFQRFRTLFLKTLPEASREGIYRLAEAVANGRLDRIAFALAPLAEGSHKQRIFIRLTGGVDHKRLTAYLQTAYGGDAAFTEKKGPRGEPITMVRPKSPPALALVGDSDLVMAGDLEGTVDATDLVQEVLAVRGGRPGLLGGPLGRLLRDARPEARLLLGGVVPLGVVSAVARSSLGAAPERFTTDMLALPGAALDLRGRAIFESEADARKFATGVRAQLKEVLEAVKELPSASRLLGELLRKVVEGIEVKTSRAEVSIRVRLPASTSKALLKVVEAAQSPQPPSGGRAP